MPIGQKFVGDLLRSTFRSSLMNQAVMPTPGSCLTVLRHPFRYVILDLTVIGSFRSRVYRGTETLGTTTSAMQQCRSRVKEVRPLSGDAVPHASQLQAQALVQQCEYAVAEAKIAILFLNQSVYLFLCILLCIGGSSKPSAGSQTYLHVVVCRYGLMIAHDREDHL